MLNLHPLNSQLPRGRFFSEFGSKTSLGNYTNATYHETLELLDGIFFPDLEIVLQFLLGTLLLSLWIFSYRSAKKEAALQASHRTAAKLKRKLRSNRDKSRSRLSEEQAISQMLKEENRVLRQKHMTQTLTELAILRESARLRALLHPDFSDLNPNELQEYTRQNLANIVEAIAALLSQEPCQRNVDITNSLGLKTPKYNGTITWNLLVQNPDRFSQNPDKTWKITSPARKREF